MRALHAFLHPACAFLRKELGIHPRHLLLGMVGSYIGIYLFEQIAFRLGIPRKTIPASIVRVSMLLAGIFYGWQIPDPTGMIIVVGSGLLVIDYFHRRHFV